MVFFVLQKFVESKRTAREHLENKVSIFFYELGRVFKFIKKKGDWKKDSTHSIGGNIMMDKTPEDTISKKFGCRPCVMGAGPVGAAGSDRLFTREELFENSARGRS